MIKQNIPNVLTLCNLLSGCIALVFALEGKLHWTACMVGICCVFDFLDGLIARALKVHSETGKQLDSLADMVSFGMVPGAIMYKLILYSQMAESVHETLRNPFQLFSDPETLFRPFFSDEFQVNPIAFIAFLIPVFSGIRLAKFNLDASQSDSFTGMPTPANTIFIASLPLVFDHSPLKGDLSINRGVELLLEELLSEQPFPAGTYFLIVLTLISSFSLIAPIRLFSLKFKDFSWQDNTVRYVFLLLAATLLIVFRYTGIPLIIVLYVILSVVNNQIIKRKNHSQYDQV